MISEVQKVVHAPLDLVWAVARDFTKSPDPSFPAEIEQKGDDAKGGVGCIRRIKMGGRLFRERLESIDPPNGYTYTMLSGGPFKSYLGRVSLTAQGNDTHISWSVDFTAKYPFISGIVNRINIKNYTKFIDELEKQLQAVG